METKLMPAASKTSRLSPEIREQLERFSAINLEEAQQKSLMDRIDTKFLLSMETFQSILPELHKDYYALEINGEKAFGYLTFYYDTPQFLAYYAHHNNIYDRYKVRNRFYTSTSDNFLELKRKSNKGRTIKKRIPVEGMLFDGIPFTSQQETEFLHTHLPETYRNLEFKLSVYYFRLTLVNKFLEERLTIDFDLGFGNAVENRTFLKNTVIVELKRPARSMDSAFKRVIRARRLRTSAFSKYTVGCSLVHPHLKQNILKPIHLKVRRIESIGTN